ncbi:sugar ABC transporter substrate-binding protein [Salinisphaera sp.]|uniref:sugar ABC transporter substrate-binding protein n=1 Tax=Salinisphaera sp. TaxID=1914330 RepID=UPI002D772291|nr:sugar ABC transporter substrate-binding protein [Salinisphaera sp.]HET7315249.1 sugar ABC transporter substrate-binding protein [Salinisphaera sp.]
MNISKYGVFSTLLALGALALSLSALPGSAQAADQKYKIYLSMSYIGNDWQSEAKNMVTAMAKYYSDKVDLHIQVAGTNAQKQIQQINGMVQAGADAIVVYPISPNALNAVVRNACHRGVVVMAYDSVITEPCAHNVTIDQHEAGAKTAQWLADTLNHKGNIVMVTGVPGTSVDKARTEAAMKVFKKYPDLHVIAKPNGMWSQAVARKVLSQVVATHGWKNIDGLWMQVGCYTATSMQIQAGIADDKLRPCAGESSNGHRVQMLDPGAVKGVSDTYRPAGLKSISYGSPIYSGALALKLALAKLDGQKKELPHHIKLPLPLVTSDQIKLCQTGSYKELAAGCNVFDPSRVPPGWFSDIYSERTPEVGFQAALNAKPEPHP